MTLSKNNLRYLTITIWALWLVLQFVVAFIYTGAPQYSDAASYLAYAQKAAYTGGWYPSQSQLMNEMHIFNPGYVNFLRILVHIGLVWAVPFINILFNAALSLAVFGIVRKLCNTSTAQIALIFFCLLPSNLMVVACRMSDLPFAALLYISIYLFQDKRYALLIIAGVLMAVANYIRPTTIIFIVPMLIYAFVKRYRIWTYLAFGLAMLCTMGAVYQFNKSNCGTGFVAASTGGVNLIQGANDNMDGSYNDKVFAPGMPGDTTGRNMDVFEKDSLWKAEAVKWIKANPVKYVIYIPIKISRLWIADYYHDLVLTPGGISTLYKIALSIPYYLIICLAMVGIYLKRKKLWGIFGLTLIPLLGICAMHGLLYGAMRYHYPAIPILIMFAAIAAYSLLKRGKSKFRYIRK